MTRSRESCFNHANFGLTTRINEHLKIATKEATIARLSADLALTREAMRFVRAHRAVIIMKLPMAPKTKTTRSS